MFGEDLVVMAEFDEVEMIDKIEFASILIWCMSIKCSWV